MITMKISNDTYEKIRKLYSEYAVNNNNEYVIFDADIPHHCRITVYTNSKGRLKAIFQGQFEQYEASIFEDMKDSEKHVINYNKSNSTLNKPCWEYLDNQIGSDEVGVADLLLPMIVVACYFSKKDIEFLIKCGVKDSKKLTDNKICEIAKIILDKYPENVCKMILPNEKYNEMIEKGENLNSLKAKLHNKALYYLSYKFNDEHPKAFIDQFCSKENYFKYIKNEKFILKDLTFKEKGETYFPSIAAASIVARYYFLQYKDEQNKKYNCEFPGGDSHQVDLFAKDFINKYGPEEYKKIAKLNFRNSRDLLNEYYSVKLI